MRTKMTLLVPRLAPYFPDYEKMAESRAQAQTNMEEWKKTNPNAPYLDTATKILEKKVIPLTATKSLAFKVLALEEGFDFDEGLETVELVHLQKLGSTVRDMIEATGFFSLSIRETRLFCFSKHCKLYAKPLPSTL